MEPLAPLYIRPWVGFGMTDLKICDISIFLFLRSASFNLKGFFLFCISEKKAFKIMLVDTFSYFQTFMIFELYASRVVTFLKV